jgi:hypothetical protein
VKAIVQEVTPFELKYRRCDMPTGPLFTIQRNTVLSIRYRNGVKEVLRQETEQPAPRTASSPASAPPSEKPFDALGLIGFILALCGWIIPSTSAFLPLALLFLGLLFSCFGLGRTTGRDAMYRGRGMGIAGLILSSIGLLIILVLIM